MQEELISRSPPRLYGGIPISFRLRRKRSGCRGALFQPVVAKRATPLYSSPARRWPSHAPSPAPASAAWRSLNQDTRLSTTRSAMALRVCTDAEPTCGSSVALGRSSSACGTFGSSAKTSRPGGEDRAVGKRSRQRCLVHRAATADIDENAIRAERRQHCGVDGLFASQRRRAPPRSACRPLRRGPSASDGIRRPAPRPAGGCDRRSAGRRLRGAAQSRGRCGPCRKCRR